MHNKKKLLITGTSLLGATAIGFGAYAYFNDSDSKTTSAKIGTVDVEANAEIQHWQLGTEQQPIMIAPNNINPGDNDPENPESYRPGTDHELHINVQNTGTKSVMTRVIVEISGTDKDNNPLVKSDLENVKLYFDEMNGISGLSAVHVGSKDGFKELKKMTENDSDEKLIYGIDGDTYSFIRLTDEIFEEMAAIAGVEVGEFKAMFQNTSDYINANMALSGTEEVEVIDGVTAPTSGSIRLDIALSKDANKNTTKLEGATLNFKVIVQGMQYRNTGAEDWEDMFSQDYIIPLA